jgi:flagellar protein FlaG
MAIKSIEASPGIDLIREAAASADNSRTSQRPPARSKDSTATVPNAAQPAVAPGTPGVSADKPKPPPAAQSSNMRVHVDQDTGKTVIELVNPESGQVLRQVPTAEALEVAKAIGRYQGMFVNLKV